MIPGRTKNFIGQDGAFIFFGIVEDRNDPGFAGRVRVRCFGIHSPDKIEIPTEDLPWSIVSSAVSETDSPHDLVEGDMVWGFFVDGQEMQEPLVCGCIQSKPGGNKNPQYGFSDPGLNVSSRPFKPQSYTETGASGGEAQNFSQQASGTNLNSYASGKGLADQAKQSTQVSAIKGPGGASLSEPANPANRKYPYNKPKETESGHVFELDDSPGSERVHLFHRSGSFIEIHPDGTVVKKSISKDYQITLGDTIQYTKGNILVSTDGSTSNYSGSSYNLEIANGDMTIDIKAGNLNLTVNGNVNQNVTGNMTSTVSGEFSVSASQIKLN